MNQEVLSTACSASSGSSDQSPSCEARFLDTWITRSDTQNNENIVDGFKPQQPPRPGVPDVVGAIELGPDCFDAVRRKIDRQNDAYREETAPRLRQDIADLVRYGCRYLLRPALQ